MKLIGQITAVAGFVAIVFGLSMWVAHAEEAHDEHPEYEHKIDDLVAATRTLQDFELRRQERDKMAREGHTSTSSAPPSNETEESDDAE